MWLLSQRGLHTVNQIDRQVDDIFEGGNTAPHDNIYNRKINVQKRLKSRRFNEENF